MKLADFHYDLPPGRIAQEPANPRDRSRLLVLEAARGRLQHCAFYELANLLRKDDVLVMNATRVFPARLRGRKRSGGKVEVLFLSERSDSVWQALVRGSTKPATLEFPEGLSATMGERTPDGEWTLHFSANHLRDYLDRHGEMPLPPYIKRPAPAAKDLERYQTVFAKTEGAVAAPTAGFHFTPDLLNRLKARGVLLLELTLHVGWGTFRPVRAERIEDHAMLPEHFEVSAETAAALTRARAEKRRIIAVGTTVVRTLETLCTVDGQFRSGVGETNLFIYPGYRFNAIDALITNFHLPDSTPLLLANAFYAHKMKTARGSHEETASGGSPFVLRQAYETAIEKGYRFYSYGDAMLIH